MSVLKNLQTSFISHLVKTLEDKIYFSERRYSSIAMFFPSVVCENGRLPLLRFKPVFYYEISKADSNSWAMCLVFRDRIYIEFIIEGNTFDDIARKRSSRVCEENERFYLNIIYFDGPIYFYAAEHLDYWEFYELYSLLPSSNFKKEARDLRPKLEAGPFYYEDKYGGDSTALKNGISTFREEECVICKDAIPDTLYCNCGHIAVCAECCFIGKVFDCPVCRTPSTNIRILIDDPKSKPLASRIICKKIRTIKLKPVLYNWNFCTLL